MLELFKTSVLHIGKGCLSMCSQKSMKTLLQRDSLKIKHTDGYSMGTRIMEGGNRDDNKKLF